MGLSSPSKCNWPVGCGSMKGAVGDPWSGHRSLSQVRFAEPSAVGQMNLSSLWYMQTFVECPVLEICKVLGTHTKKTKLFCIHDRSPGSKIGKTQISSLSWAAGHVWAWDWVHTRLGIADSAARFDLPLASPGPISQTSLSSSHHSEVSRVVVSFCPPIAKSRGWVEPTGIIWKKARACLSLPPLRRALVAMV